MKDLIKNVNTIRRRIQEACIRSNRRPEEIRLLMATKTVPAGRIKSVIECSGECLIAENKVQELKEKYPLLKDTPHTNHFIGHLQTNKVKDILRYDVACLQSLDRLDLAERLHQRLSSVNRSMDVLIQVNTSGESSKFGVHPDKAAELVRGVAGMPSLHIRGLMTIGILSNESDRVRSCFRLLRQLAAAINVLEIPGVEMRELSMGMSGDLEIAIEEGATIIRVGTAIFGERLYPGSYYWDEDSRLC